MHMFPETKCKFGVFSHTKSNIRDGNNFRVQHTNHVLWRSHDIFRMRGAKKPSVNEFVPGFYVGVLNTDRSSDDWKAQNDDTTPSTVQYRS